MSELRNELDKWRNKTIGFVPTMGCLHPGHESLLLNARAECDCVVLSIFVNPYQFGENEDVDFYPRDISRDIGISEKANVDILFYPSFEDMYAKKPLTKIHMKKITSTLCGLSRPGHFESVALVVAKLFNMILPQRAYFGAKDAQQVAVIQQLVEDLSFPIDVVVCPTFREEDGLAMSSRNLYLTQEERDQAAILSIALDETKNRLRQDFFYTVLEINQYVTNKIQTMSLAKIVYVETLTYPGLEPIEQFRNETIIVAVAVKFGKTRLIDNLIITC